MRSGGRIAGAALLLGGWLTLAAAGEPGLHAERLAAAPAWQGPQKVQADAKGNVFLLRGETLEVYPVLKDAALGKPVKLEAYHSLNGPVIDAAMGPGPGDWLLRLPLGGSTPPGARARAPASPPCRSRCGGSWTARRRSCRRSPGSRGASATSAA